MDLGIEVADAGVDQVDVEELRCDEDGGHHERDSSDSDDQCLGLQETDGQARSALHDVAMP